MLEIASNDGYLLRNFVQRNIRCVGVEAGLNVAADALALGVNTRVGIWGCEMADELVEEGCLADFGDRQQCACAYAPNQRLPGSGDRVLSPMGCSRSNLHLSLIEAP